jgi:hypothetical protein
VFPSLIIQVSLELLLIFLAVQSLFKAREITRVETDAQNKTFLEEASKEIVNRFSGLNVSSLPPS